MDTEARTSKRRFISCEDGLLWQLGW